MKLSQFIEVHGQQTKLAREIAAQPQLVWQWARGVRPVPIERCVAIERATGGAVTRQDLRPDDWQSIWPELAQEQGNPAAQQIQAQAATEVVAAGGA
jgi:DNA-binding transcriptional regulator YdaS (Cro superfamily)